MHPVQEHKHIKQTLTELKGETDSHRIVVGNFNTPLSTFSQKINIAILDFNDMLVQMNLTDIYRTFYPKVQNIHSSPAHTEHSPGQIIC